MYQNVQNLTITNIFVVGNKLLKMVLYDDKKWLCRLIRTAFTIEDDSGICEKVLKERPHLGNKSDQQDSSISSEDSFDIREGADLGHRRRSNTAIRLEKLDKQRKAQNATQNIRVNLIDNTGKSDITFERNEEYQNIPKVKNVVSIDRLLQSTPHPDSIPYATYAKFDGSCHPSVPCKRLAIFLSFLPPRLRAYPIKVSVASTAKVLELIGLALWMTSQSYPDIRLKSVHQYNLQIADEDGEWDGDFPPLDNTEPVSKFSFSHLALVYADGQLEQSKQSYNLSFLLPSGGVLKMPLDDLQTSLKDVITLVLNKSGWNKQHANLIDSSGYHLEKLGNPGAAFKDSNITVIESKCRDFCLVRNGAKSVQAVVSRSEASSSQATTEIPGGRSDLYPVTVTGRFNRVRNALCVILGRERMDLEFQTKTKSYPFSHISGVKLDAAKNRVVVSISQVSPTTVGSHYLTNTSHLQLSTTELRTATELYHHLTSIIGTK